MPWIWGSNYLQSAMQITNRINETIPDKRKMIDIDWKKAYIEALRHTSYGKFLEQEPGTMDRHLRNQADIAWDMHGGRDPVQQATIDGELPGEEWDDKNCLEKIGDNLYVMKDKDYQQT